MNRIIAFAGSTSTTSINKQLVTYVANLLTNNVKVLDLNDYKVPIYSVDVEKEIDYPKEALKFNEELETADAFVVSLAEHNGSFAAGYKNLFDWVSRKQSKVFRNKPILLLATSPGGRGGASVLNLAINLYPHMGGIVTSSFSLPNFYDNFSEGKISNTDLDVQLNEAISIFKESL